MLVRSIRWQLVASYVLLTLMVVSLVGILALAQVRRHAQQQELDYLLANAEALASQSLPYLGPGPHPAALHNLALTSSFLGNVRVRILDSRRQVLADSGTPGKTDEIVWAVSPDGSGGTVVMLSWPEASRTMGHEWQHPPMMTELQPGAQYGLIRRKQHLWGDRFIFQELHAADQEQSKVSPAVPAEEQEVPRSSQVVMLPVGDSNRPLGYVELSNGPDFGAEAIATTRQAFIFAAAGTGLIALLLGLLMSQRLTSPLNSLTLAAGAMSRGDLSVRAQVGREDEIGELGHQFNSMAERLEASFAQLAAERDALRRFIADASHELRTPITALKTFQELLMERAADDPAAQREFLMESQMQINRLEWITHNLLDLSRFDAGLINLETAQHDTAEIIQAASSPFRPQAQERGITLAIETPQPPVMIECDRARVELAISNLLDNALKFTPPGGQVRISAEQAGATLRIQVQDTGVGIPDGELWHIFERFYRGRSVQSSGSGLGLAIVKSIVQLHAGQIQVSSTLGEGSSFTLDLPLQGPPQQSLVPATAGARSGLGQAVRLPGSDAE